MKNIESHPLSVASIKTQFLGEFLNMWIKHFFKGGMGEGVAEVTT